MTRTFTKPMLYKSEHLTNRRLKEVLPDGAWQNKPCFIIGGGPSLQNFNWTLLKGHRTIGINLAFTKHDPTIIFSMDTRFLRWLETQMYGPAVTEAFRKSRAYKVWLCTYTATLPEEIFIIPVIRNYAYGLRHFSWSLTDGIGHGNNSGYAALNLACCLGSNPIYLLGFDCRHKDGKSHWHKGHPQKQAESTVKSFIEHFNRAAPQIKQKGIKVINLNPDSALNCFEKKPIEEVLH